MTPERTKEEILRDLFDRWSFRGITTREVISDAFYAGEKWQESQPVESKWVSVKERLPEKYDRVIVSGGVAYLSRSGNWFSITGMEYPGRVIEWEVTHWQPLPELPSPTIEETKQI